MIEAPKTVLPKSVGSLPYSRVTSEGEVPLYVIDCPEYEVVRFTFLFRAGTSLQSTPFAASATANMLSEGSALYSSQEIAERLDFLGSYFEVNVDRDYTYVSFCSLRKFFERTVEVAEQILLCPTFPAEELATYAAKRKQRLSIERMKVDTLAREEFARAMFGEEHPYGAISHESGYDTLTRDDVVAHYKRFYTAERCFVVCSGMVDEGVVARLRSVASQLPHGSHDEMLFPPVVQRRESMIHREGALQSSIRIGWRLFTRSHPDFVGMQVVATALGGYMGSRLMQNLRERNGFTYGVVAAMVNFEREGYLAIATQVDSTVTERAVEEICREVELLGSEPMSDEELDMVRNMMTGEMMRVLDGPFGIADVTIENILCGEENDVVERNLQRIREITPAEVQSLARKYLRREEMVKVVVGSVE